MKPDSVDVAFRVYGDNILETELLIKWARKEESGFRLVASLGPLDRPVYIFEDKLEKSSTYAFQICPGYDRWPKDPLKGLFHEKPDIVVTKVVSKEEETKPVLAIETCGAIQAGNQGWQRFRRAIDSAKKGIPYFYFLPLVDWEITSDSSNLKNPRYQNPLVSLAHLSLCSKYRIPSLMIYEITSWYKYVISSDEDYPLPEEHKQFSEPNHCIKYLFLLLRAKHRVDAEFTEELIEFLSKILKEMLLVTKRYAKYKRTKLPIHLNHPALNQSPDTVAYKYAKAIVTNESVPSDLALHNLTLSDFKKHGTTFQKRAQRGTCSNLFYKKILNKVNWKVSANKRYKREYLAAWGINMKEENYTSSDLNFLVRENFGRTPVAYKDPPSEAAVINNRKAFRQIVEDAYPELSTSIFNWIYSKCRSRDKPLLFIPLYGYKPSGDSRPDRGLLPLLVALFPKIATKQNMLVIMYSKHTPENWQEILKRKSNKLWSTISDYAGAIIVDKTKSGLLLE